jgi:hypothetical protein
MAMARRPSRFEDQTVSGSVVVWLAGLVFGLGAGMVLVYHMVLSERADLTPPPARPVALTTSTSTGVDPALLAVHNAEFNDRKQTN